LEVLGESPTLRTAILDRGTLNPVDTRYYIRPEVVTLQDNVVAFFFNAFERPLQVTIIQPGTPGFHETVRMIQPLEQNLSPIMRIQEIESHRLFTAEMLSLYMDTLNEGRALETTPNSTVKWGPKIERESRNDIIMTHGMEGSPPHIESLPPDILESGIVEAQTRTDTSDRVGDKRKLPSSEGSTVVLRKRRWGQGKGRGQQKIQIRWATSTFPCAFSSLLTPTKVITDVGTHVGIQIAVLLKATLSSNDLLAALQRDIPLSEQGVEVGDILTLSVRHATILDPNGDQHLVAYREDETIRDLLVTLQTVSPISPLSDIILYYNEYQLDHNKRFQDCNLPDEPTLHASLSTIGGTSPARSDLDAGDPAEGPGFEPTDMDRDETLEQGDHRKDTAADEKKTGPHRSQVFLQDLKGKTHTLIFHTHESLAKNLLAHSFQLQFTTLQETYLLADRHVLKLAESLNENGLLQEPLLRVMLRCRGGMRGAPKSPAQGTLGAKGRGTRSPGGGGRQMGGSDGGEDPIHRMPPSRGERGRGSGSHKRSTIVHSGTQETLDEDERSASLKAIQETHRIMMMQHCRQSWEETDSIIGFGLPPKAASETPHQNIGLNQQTGIGPGAPSTLPTTTIAARKLDMELLEHESYSAEERDPESHRTEAKKG